MVGKVACVVGLTSAAAALYLWFRPSSAPNPSESNSNLLSWVLGISSVGSLVFSRSMLSGLYLNDPYAWREYRRLATEQRLVSAISTFTMPKLLQILTPQEVGSFIQSMLD